MAVRTIRHLAIYGAESDDLVHVVKNHTSRGYNGTNYDTRCGATLMSGVNWEAAQYEIPTCVRCLGTPKTCVKCGWPLSHSQLPSDVLERCDECAG